MTEKWKTADAKQFGAIDAFQKRELAGQYSPSKFLFYPLSGPDVLYATRFFPEATTMVFAGLEPVGHIRKPESYKARQSGERIERLGEGAIVHLQPELLCDQ